MPSPSYQSGFTLLEMLVTLSLLALLSLLAWRALDTGERSVRAVRASADDTLMLVRGLDQLAGDVSRHASALETSPVQGALSATTLLPSGVHWQDDTLRVMQRTRSGDIQQVLWLRNGTKLQRQSGIAASPDQPWHAQDTHTALANVLGFDIRVWVHDRGWLSPANVPAGLRASGLEIRVARQEQGRQATYRKVVLLP